MKFIILILIHNIKYNIYNLAKFNILKIPYFIYKQKLSVNSFENFYNFIIK